MVTNRFIIKPCLLHTGTIKNTRYRRQSACILLLCKAEALRMITGNNKKRITVHALRLLYKITHRFIRIPDMTKLGKCFFITGNICRQLALNLCSLEAHTIHINAVRRMISCCKHHMENLFLLFFLAHISFNLLK